MVFAKLLHRQQLHAGLLLFAFLPTLVFLGHWGDTLTTGPLVVGHAAALIDQTPQVREQHAEEAEHAEHCHTNLASCSAQPLPSGLGFFVSGDTLLKPPPLRILTPYLASVTRAGRLLSPPVPPPRAR